MPKGKSPSSSGKKKRKDIKKKRRSSTDSKPSPARALDLLEHAGPDIDEDGDPRVEDEDEEEREERVRLSKKVDAKSPGSSKKSKSSKSDEKPDWDSLKGAEFDMSDDEASGHSKELGEGEKFVATAIGDDENGESDSDAGNDDSSDGGAAMEDAELDEDREDELRAAVQLRAASKKVSLFGGDEDDDDESDEDADSKHDGVARADESDSDSDEDEEDEDEDGGAGADGLLRRSGESFETFGERVELARQKETAAARAEMQIHTLGREDLKYHLPTDEEMDEERRMPPDLEAIRERMKAVVLVLSDFKERRQDSRSRGDYLERLTEDAIGYYGYSGELVELFLKIFKPVEALEFFEANEQPRPLTLRVNTLKARRKQVAQALINRGVNLDPLAGWSRDGLVVHESNIPIGATPEYLTGHYFIQSASSMMSVLALDPRPGERIIDVAAAPGGKTTHIAQLLRNRGALVANDPSPTRSRSLVANMARLGVTCAIASCLDGREIHKVFGLGSFDRVLLDAPCTGLGVIAKDPSVKTQKTYEDVKKMAYLQKQLCLAAVDAVDHASPTGGIFVYSTCSVSVEENEAVVDYLLRKRHVKLVKIQEKVDVGRPAMPAYFHHRFHPSLKLARRFLPHVHNMDGFFVAKFQKLAPGAKDESADDDDEGMDMATGGGDESMSDDDSSDGGEEGEEDESDGDGEEESDDDDEGEDGRPSRPLRRKGGKLVKETKRKGKSRVSPSAADLRRMEEEAKVARKKAKAKKREEKKKAKRERKEREAAEEAAGGSQGKGKGKNKKRSRAQMELSSAVASDDSAERVEGDEGESEGEGASTVPSGNGSGSSSGAGGVKSKRKRERRKRNLGKDGKEKESKKRRVDPDSESKSKPPAGDDNDDDDTDSSAPMEGDSAAGTADQAKLLGKRVKGKKKRMATIGAGDEERALGRLAAEQAAMAVYSESEMQRLQDERKRSGADKLEAMGMRKSTGPSELAQEARERADAILGEAEATGSAKAFKLKGKRKRAAVQAVAPASSSPSQVPPTNTNSTAGSTPGPKKKKKKKSRSSMDGDGDQGVAAAAVAEHENGSADSDASPNSGKKKKSKKSKDKKAKAKSSSGEEGDDSPRKRVSFGGENVREFDKFMNPRAAGMDIDEARKSEGGGKSKRSKKGGKKGGKRS